MILPGASFGLQLLFDLLAPLLLLLLFRRGRFYHNDLGLEDPFKPEWVRNLWKYILGITYIWFFSATIWHFILSAAH
jgi:hypothetical protein